MAFSRPAHDSKGTKNNPPDGNRMVYEGNPKHKHPWQPGRKGSLCPSSITLPQAQELLEGSVVRGSARFAVLSGQAYCAREHRSDRWHGYPVQWHEVPPDVQATWVR